MKRDPARLDSTDEMILTHLTQNAALKNVELARRVGVAPSTCLERVRKLERHGYIVGYRAIVARSGRGARLEGWADIRFGELTPEVVDQFRRLVRASPEIIEAHRIAGQSDFAVRFCGGDLTAWSAFSEALTALGGDAQARLSILVEPLK